MRDITWENVEAEGDGTGTVSLETLDENIATPTAPMEETICDQLYLQELLTQLTPLEREIVMLRAEGNSYKCIAGMLGISVKKVAMTIEGMRERLGKQGYSIAGREEQRGRK